MKQITFLVAGLCLMLALPCQAQRHEILNPNIASLQVVAGNRWMDMPVIQLNDEPIHISFDDLTHEYHRYAYRIEHCEADWTPSRELFASDFCEGFCEGNLIEDIEESVNTNVQYTHYHVQLPNSQCRLILSGNYRLTIYDDDKQEDVLQACFMVVQPLVGVSMSINTDTDADINGRHQQVSMQLTYMQVRPTDLARQLKTVVLQNGRWDNAIVNAKPQYVMANGLRWEHCRDFIFDGGNEYRKFEMLDVHHTTMGLESIGWDGSNYHAYPWTDEPRPNYVYDEDANGAFYIRNSDNIENDCISEYLQVHFRLKAPQQEQPIYLQGVWTNDQLLPDFQMEYDEVEQIYHKDVMLKQGYYSYQYITFTSDGRTIPLDSEGNFYQTENVYQALIYYKGTGERTDRLIGYGEIRKK